MRRVFLRMLALATVLVLGIIAIAQAQRGTQAESQQPPAAGPSLQAATGEEASAVPRRLAAGPEPNPLRGAGQAEEAPGAPRRLAAKADENPLRVDRGPAPGDVVAAAAASPEEPKAAPNPIRPPLTPMAQKAAPPAKERESLDPFARPAGPPAARPGFAGTGADNDAGPPRGTAIASDAPAALPPRRGPFEPSKQTSEPRPLANPPASGRAAALPRSDRMEEFRPGAAGPAAGDAHRAEPARGGEGTGKPGSRHLEGPQAPQLLLQKTAPAEVQVGKPATFQIKLRNTGLVAAHNVEIRDEIPKGTRLVGTNPRSSRGVRGELVWSLGTVEPGKEVSVEVQLMPTDEGEIGSVATVSFNADATARTVATRPQLAIKASAPPKVLIGEELTLSITVSNPGTGIAQKVVLEEQVPPGLRHPGGSELVYQIGDLKPNESRQVELKLAAAQAGRIVNVLAVRGDANLRAEDRTEIDVLAPRLDLSMDGPKRRYLEREATYVVSVSNPGTAPARQVELVAQLPPGLKFVNANNAGQYEEATRTVHWLLEELPSKETGSVELTAVPVEIGEQTLRVRGSAERGLSVEKEHPIVIDGIAALLFEVVDTHDPIEVGGETTYDIRVLNQGSKGAGNVRVTVLVPAELKPVAAEGPEVRYSIEPGRVVFEPLRTLAPKANTTYRVRVQGLKPGDQRIRVQLLTDEIREPITKEESTRVYSDE